MAAADVALGAVAAGVVDGAGVALGAAAAAGIVLVAEVDVALGGIAAGVVLVAEVGVALDVVAAEVMVDAEAGRVAILGGVAKGCSFAGTCGTDCAMRRSLSV